MRRNSQYVISGLGVVVALSFFVIGLEVSASTVGSGADRAAPHRVDRTLKGDRLPLIPEKARKNAVNGPIEILAPRTPVRLELPDGCEAIVSQIAQSPLAQVPGRCVS